MLCSKSMVAELSAALGMHLASALVSHRIYKCLSELGQLTEFVHDQFRNQRKCNLSHNGLVYRTGESLYFLLFHGSFLCF